MLNKFLLLLLAVASSGCSFHLRGSEGSYQFPYAKVYLDCDKVIICPGLKSTITHEHLTTLVNQRESANAIIIVSNEETSRDTYNLNSVGQIASYLLTYQVTAQIYNRQGEQIGSDIVVQNQMVMAYNNSLILSAKDQEDVTWDQIHQNIINTLIRRIVYLPVKQMSYATESN